MCLVYLSSTTLTTDHQGLVHRLQLAPNIPVGFFCHNKDMRLELLQAKMSRFIKWMVILTACRAPDSLKTSQMLIKAVLLSFTE